jgi:hypothetical protein
LGSVSTMVSIMRILGGDFMGASIMYLQTMMTV